MALKGKQTDSLNLFKKIGSFFERQKTIYNNSRNKVQPKRDFHSAIQFSAVHHFADDTNLLFSNYSF